MAAADPEAYSCDDLFYYFQGCVHCSLIKHCGLRKLCIWRIHQAETNMDATWQSESTSRMQLRKILSFNDDTPGQSSSVVDTHGRYRILSHLVDDNRLRAFCTARTYHSASCSPAELAERKLHISCS